MPRNSSGVYSLPNAPFVPGTVISSAAVNGDFSDIATALTGSVASNGSTPITGTIKFTSGTAALPGITFSADTTTGLYSGGAGILGLSAGAGVAAVLIDSTQVGTGKSGNQLYYANGAVPGPVGMIVDFAGATPPTGWMLCLGQAIPRAGYPELFQTIGTTYGVGDGSTTYNLPDCRGRFTAGVDAGANRITNAGSGVTGSTLGAVGGSQNQTLLQANMPVTGPTFTGTPQSWNLNQNMSFWSGVQSAATAGTGAVSPLGMIQYTPGSVNVTPSGTVAGGSGTPVVTMPPVIIFNKMIFAGRP